MRRPNATKRRTMTIDRMTLKALVEKGSDLVAASMPFSSCGLARQLLWRFRAVHSFNIGSPEFQRAAHLRQHLGVVVMLISNTRPRVVQHAVRHWRWRRTCYCRMCAIPMAIMRTMRAYSSRSGYARTTCTSATWNLAKLGSNPSWAAHARFHLRVPSGSSLVDLRFAGGFREPSD